MLYLNSFSVKLSLNTNYYLDHRDELEKDLNRQVSDLECVEDKCLEKELLYKQLCKLFGENGTISTSNEFDYILQDFIWLEDTGNFGTATAKRGEYYLKFDFYSS